MNPSQRGAFIALEGGDGAGKSTQARLIQEHLESQKIPCMVLAFPDRETSETGKLIADYLTKKITFGPEAIHLIFAANRREMEDLIRGSLQSGMVVIVDRYLYSGIVYSAANGLDLEWCKQADVRLCEPDHVFYMKVPPRTALERSERTEIYETLEFQEKVVEFFDTVLADAIPIDATQEPAVITQEILSHVTLFPTTDIKTFT